MQSVFVEQHTQTLPPLILHPFADASGPGKLVESSRASLMLQGLLPSGEFTAEQLETRLLEGRYCEIRMLFYVGRDLIRWIDQCIELSEREGTGYTFQSFVSLLISHTPPAVQAKLRRWGVADYRSIFSRAIALNAMFAEAPSRQTLSNDFTRNYYRFTDQVFKMLMESTHKEAGIEELHFELFASGEYSKMLEEEWGEA